MQIQLIKKHLERVFNGPAWHGPSVKETLVKISKDHSSNSFKNSHALIEILGHMTVWRNFVTERLKGNNDYEVADELNFPKSNDLNGTIAELHESQKNLIEQISMFPEERLREKVGGRTYSFQTMLHGIVQHDLYHLGQIVLLNR